MPKWTVQQATNLTRARTLRRSLAPYEGWPRSVRAWARWDRIDALLKEIETTLVGATKEDPRFVRVWAELEEWLARERAFIREYPIFMPPDDWTRRPVPRHQRPTDS